MSKNATSSENSDAQCPTCGRDDFANRRAMKVHHSAIHDEKLPQGTPVECDWCGETTRKFPSRVNGEKRNFCDVDCQMEWRKETGAFRGEAHPEYSENIELECAWCGDTILRKPNRVRCNNHFCDHDCYAEFRSENYVGEDYPMFDENSEYATIYGEGWTDKKKAEIRERDDYTCRGCDMTQEEHLDEYGRKLHVHHICRARELEDAPSEVRNGNANLITFCAKCHFRWEGIPVAPQ